VRLILAALLFSLAAPAVGAPVPSRGEQLFQSGDWERARAEFSDAVRRNDRDARAHYYLGRLALLDNDLDQASEQLKRAVDLEEGLSDHHLWYAKAMMQQAMHAQNPLLAMGVKAQLERAVALDGRSLDARDVLLDYYSMAPAMMGGGSDKARAQADSIARLDAMRGHYALGRLAVRSNDSTAAIRELNAAIALKPDTLPAYATLASWYGSRNDWPRAFATLDRYVQRRPADPSVLYTIGRASATSGQELDRGERALRKYIAGPPKDAPRPTIALACLRLGQILDREGKSGEARAAYQRALELDPRNEDARKALK